MSRPSLPRTYDNVFVLSTGRVGSVTFGKACEHFTNYTSGHETRCRETDDARLAYPKGHIEVDNRLAWYLGRVEKTFGDNAFYVHLVRDPEKIAASYDRRWTNRGSVLSAFTFGIRKQPRPDSD